MQDPETHGSGEVLVLAEPELAFRGDVRGSGTPRILRTVLRSGESGVLSFWSGLLTKRLYISKGRLLQVTSNDPDERLGEILLVEGRITARQYIEASKLIAPGRKLGTLLVETGALDPGDLIPAITAQAKRMLFDLFTWTTGTYEMSLGDIDASDFVPMNLPADELIVQGMRNIRAWSPVFSGIQSLETVFFRNEGIEPWQLKVELNRDEETVLSRVNGRSSVEEICALSFGSHFETCRILWTLSVLGLIQRAEAADIQRSIDRADEDADRLEVSQMTDRFNRLFERIHDYLDARPGAGARAFAVKAFEEVAPAFGTLFEGLVMEGSGRIDPERLYENLRREPIENRRMLASSGLSELVYAMQFLIRQNYGVQEEAVVSGFIRDGL